MKTDEEDGGGDDDDDNKGSLKRPKAEAPALTKLRSKPGHAEEEEEEEEADTAAKSAGAVLPRKAALLRALSRVHKVTFGAAAAFVLMVAARKRAWHRRRAFRALMVLNL